MNRDASLVVLTQVVPVNIHHKEEGRRRQQHDHRTEAEGLVVTVDVLGGHAVQREALIGHVH